jgi:hypothetical protein
MGKLQSTAVVHAERHARAKLKWLRSAPAARPAANECVVLMCATPGPAEASPRG